MRNQKLNIIQHQVNPEPDEEDDPEISVGGAGRTEDNDEDYYDIDETGTYRAINERNKKNFSNSVEFVLSVFTKPLYSLYI